MKIKLIICLFLSITSPLLAQNIKIEQNEKLHVDKEYETTIANNDFVLGKIYFKIHDNSHVVLPEFVGNLNSEGYPYFQSIISEVEITSIKTPFSRISPKLARVYELDFKNYNKTNRLIEFIKSLPFIDYCEQIPLNSQKYCAGNDPLSVDEYHHDLMKICDAWNYGKGDGVVIAFIDDAFNIDHEDLKHSVDTNMTEFNGTAGVDDDNNGYVDDIYGWDFAENDNDVNPSRPDTIFPKFNQSHGSTVAGVAVATYNNNLGISSIAPNAKAMYLKNYGIIPYHGHVGQTWIPLGGWNEINEAIAYAIDNGADIINMSFGTKASTITTTKILLEAADSAGILLVAAAGNHGNDGLTELPFPARMPEVIAVGSTNEFDRKTKFSNFAFNTDICAPGINIPTTSYLNSSSYVNSQGTSISSPIVAGVLALMKSANPSLTKDQLRECLFKSADDINIADPFYGSLLGHGRANALLAVQCVKNYSASFRADAHESILCQSDTVVFHPYNDYDSDSVSYEWYFGDGGKLKSDSFISHINYVYSHPGIYSVRMLIKSKNGIVLDEIERENWFVVDDCDNEYIQDNHTLWNYGSRVSLDFSSGIPVSTFGGTHSFIQDQCSDFRNNSYHSFAGRSSSAYSYSRYYRSGSNLQFEFYDTVKSKEYKNGQRSVINFPYSGANNKHVYVYASSDNDYWGAPNQEGLKFSIHTKPTNTSPISDIYGISTPGNYKNLIGNQITTAAITAAKKCESDAYWIVTHNAVTDTNGNQAKDFLVLQLNPNNPDNMLVEFVDTFPSGLIMTDAIFKFSPIGNYIGVGREVDGGRILYESMHIYNFNKATGAISPFKSYNLGSRHFEFSNNERFLYVYSDSSESLYQYDLQDNNPNTQVIRIADNLKDFSGIQLGPDGRIYIEGTEPSFQVLSYIAYPDKKETGNNECGWMYNAFDLNALNTGGAVSGGGGFPNVVVANKMELDVSIGNVTCNTVQFFIDQNQLACGTNVEWEFNGQTISGPNKIDATFSYTEARKYGLKIRNGSFEYITTIDLTRKIEPSSEVIYPGNFVTLELTTPALSKSSSIFTWYRNGHPISGDSMKVDVKVPGEYWLEVNGSCGHFLTNKITLKMDCEAPMDESFSGEEYTFGTGLHSLNSVTTPGLSNAYHITGKWFLEPGAIVQIDQTNLIFDEGAEIVVSKGAQLEIHRSVLSGCGRWRGITVIGDPNTGAGRIHPYQYHGSFLIFDSYIQDASCGVYSKEGGIVISQSNEFGKNYLHAAFTRYDYKHLSFITNTTFENIDILEQQLETNHFPNLINAFGDTLPLLYLDKIDSVYIETDTFLYNPYPEQPFDNCNTYIGLFSNGTIDSSISNCYFGDNQFTLSRLDHNSHITYSKGLTFKDNDFGTHQLFPLQNTYYSPNPVPTLTRYSSYFKEPSNLSFHSNNVNYYTRGVEIYIDNTDPTDTISIRKNEFNGNEYALAISPEEFPLNSKLTSNTSTNNMEISIRCNGFYTNSIGIVGSGWLMDQGDVSNPFDNLYNSNVDWDAIWGNGKSGFRNYYYYNEPNSYFGLNLPSLEINGTLYDSPNNSWVTALSNNSNNSCSLPNTIKKTSLEHIDYNDYTIKAYPNPFNNNISIVSKEFSKDVQINMIDILGKRVPMEFHIQEKLIESNTSSLAKGIYFLVITNYGKVTTLKLTKVRE